MSYQGDAAEQVVRLTLNGAEVAARITGAGAKQLAVLLYAILREQKKTRGKARLSNMLRSGKELKVFAVKESDLQRFCTEAKKYGVLYCVLRDKKASDGIVDIMVRAEDASKINRIFDRFQLATVDMGSVKSEIERSRNASIQVPVTEKAERQRENTDALLDHLLAPGSGKEQAQPQNPTTAERAGSSRSEPISENRRAEKPTEERPSVRKELREIRDKQKAEAKTTGTPQKNKNKTKTKTKTRKGR